MTPFLEKLKSKGWKAKELAERWGITPRQISNISKKPSKMNLDALEGLPENNIAARKEAWNKTKRVPDNDRFVTLILRDGRMVEAKWANSGPGRCRPGKQWFDKDGKYVATGINPAIAWEEI